MTTRRAWLAPERSLELAGRAASLTFGLACVANTLLIWVAFDDDWFEWMITIVAGVAALGMLSRVVFPVSRWSEEATWLASGMWIAQLVEIATSPHVSTAGKFRNGGFYLAFAVGCMFIYLIERVYRKLPELVEEEP